MCRSFRTTANIDYVTISQRYECSIPGYRMLLRRTARWWTVRLRTVRRNFPKRVDGTAKSHDTYNTDNMNGAAELDTLSVINKGT